MMRRFVIIGNGAAANSAAEAIRKHDAQSSMIMYSREPHGYYYTPALPEFLAGEKMPDDLMIRRQKWYDQHDVELRLNCPVVEILPAKRRVLAVDGQKSQYDVLLLATGGNAFVPPIPGAELPGVFSLRTMADAVRIRSTVRKGQRLVLIGGGLLGLEAGNGLRRAGLNVHVVEFFTRLLPRQMDTDGARLLQDRLEKMGFSFSLGAKTTAILRRDKGLEVRLAGGEALAADVVLISAGVRPELTLAKKLGLQRDKGVLVNDRMQTSLPDIYAAGDIAEHRGIYYGIWPAAMEQGRVAGLNMAGVPTEYGGTVPANALKVAGISLTSAGDIDAEGEQESTVHQDLEQGVYRKLVFKDERIVGAVFLGDERGSKEVISAMRLGRVITADKDVLKDPGFNFSSWNERPSR